jgi:3-hydroxyisobutyrate dehydrogenase-like beta-hydroxyacid dehydrogenase
MLIGFVGTGTMGTSIAGCLIRAGHSLKVYDRRPEATATLCAQGAIGVDSPFAAARDSEVVFTSLPGPVEFEAAMLEPECGVLAGLRPGFVHIDLTTNAPKTIARVGEACRSLGTELIDAPVSGRPPTMTVMIGGSDAAFGKHRPLFEAIAADVFHVGPSGAGTTAKLVTQYLGYTNFVASIEGMLVAAKAGMTSTRWPGLCRSAPGKAAPSTTFPVACFQAPLPPAGHSTSSPRISSSRANSPVTSACRRPWARSRRICISALKR